MSAASPSSSPQDIDLDALIQSLPACKRCRECRRGCDTLLPKCRQCTKAGSDCLFYDHGRNELLPRSYIAGLIDHVRKLHANSNPSPAASGSGPTPQDSATAMSTPTANVKTESLRTESIASETTQGHPVQPEHYFAEAAGSYRYLGPEACLVRSPRQEAKGLDWGSNEEDDDWQISWRQSEAKKYELVEVYLEHVQFLYPILDASARYLAPEPPVDLTELELFNLNMIYSIGCHVLPLTGRKRRHPDHLWNLSGRLTYYMGNYTKYRQLAQNFFEAAENYMEAATADATIEGLRAILLLAINSLFDPKIGNIGQQIALAMRLTTVLKQKINEMGPGDAHMIRNMHTTVFSLENEIATVFDRPATFPEPEWELSFDVNKPADYICSIYRLQHRFRNGDTAAKDLALKQLPLLDVNDKLPTKLSLILHQTHLLFNPVWQTAWQVLESVVAVGNIHIYLTPHWVYRAATVLIKEDINKFHPHDFAHLYSNALLILELSSMKWGESSARLAGSLADLMQQMKTKITGPPWDRPHVLYDVRL